MNKKRWIILAVVIIAIAGVVVIYRWPRHISNVCDINDVAKIELSIYNMADKFEDMIDVPPDAGSDSPAGHYRITEPEQIDMFMEMLESFTLNKILYIDTGVIHSRSVTMDASGYNLDFAFYNSDKLLMTLDFTTDYNDCFITYGEVGAKLAKSQWSVDAAELSRAIDNFVLQLDLIDTWA